MDLKNLSAEDKTKLLAAIQQQKEEIKGSMELVKAEDPYWFFEPSDGSFTPESKAFLEKWLRPEDVPTRLDGQLDVLKCAAEIILLAGGNQAGKTMLNAFLTHAKVTGEVPEHLKGIIPESKLPTKWPVFGRVYAPSAATIEEIIVPKFQELMPKKYWHPSGWERTYNKQDKMLRYYKNGKFIGQVKFMSCEQEVSKTQGASLSFAHFDEEPPYEFYKECLPRFTTKKYIDIGFFMTPTNGLTWVKDEIVDKEDGKIIKCFKLSSVTNKHANLTSLDAIVSGQGSYEERKLRLLGEFVSLSGLIYTGECGFREDKHLIQPFELNSDYIVYRGLDNHLAKPTAVVELAVAPNGQKIVVGCYYDQADTEKVKRDLAQRAKDRKYRLGWTRYDKSLDYEIQALGGINIIQKLKEPPNPIPAMFPSEKYKGSIEAGVDTIKQWMKVDPMTGRPGILFFDTPEVWQLIRDIKSLERDKYTNEDKKGLKDKINEGKRDRHAALRYISQNHVEWIPPYDDAPITYEAESFI